MRRRALLSALTAGAVPLGGCLSRFPADDPSPTGSPTRTPSDSPTVTPPHDSPPCPDLGDDAETVCVGDRPADPRSALFDPTVPDATLPTAEAAFSLSNTTDADISSNFYSWRLFKYAETGGNDDAAAMEWVHVTPRPVPQPLMILEPGGSHTWTLAVDNTILGSDEGAADAGGTTDIPIAGLGPGEYAFAIGVHFPAAATRTASDRTETTTGSSTSTRSATATSTPTAIDRPQHVQYVAKFRLTGPAPDLLPAHDAEILDKRDGLLEVITDAGRENEHPETVVVERAPEQAHDAEALPLELAYRIHGVRNTVPFFEADVERVELTTGNYVLLLPFEEGGRYATVQGQTYRFDRASE